MTRECLLEVDMPDLPQESCELGMSLVDQKIEPGVVRIGVDRPFAFDKRGIFQGGWLETEELELARVLNGPWRSKGFPPPEEIRTPG